MKHDRIVINSPRLLDLARSACDCGRQEQAPTAIILAVIAAEGFINELGEFAANAAEIHEGDDPDQTAALGTILTSLEEQSANLQSKYQLASYVLTGKMFDKGAQPFQDFNDLVNLRNDLVHFKYRDKVSTKDSSVFEVPHRVVTLQQKGLARTAVPESPDSWIDLLMTKEVAAWACETSLVIIRAILVKVVNGDIQFFFDRFTMNGDPGFLPSEGEGGKN